MEKETINILSFSEKILNLCSKVPPGKVTTYKEIASVLGIKAYQAIGNALRNNPYSPIVPCHRVIKSNGNVGGYNGKIVGKEVKKKIDLLQKEGVEVIVGKVDLSRYLFKF